MKLIDLQVLKDKPALSRWSLKYEVLGRDVEFSWLARNMQVRIMKLYAFKKKNNDLVIVSFSVPSYLLNYNNYSAAHSQSENSLAIAGRSSQQVCKSWWYIPQFQTLTFIYNLHRASGKTIFAFLFAEIIWHVDVYCRALPFIAMLPISAVKLVSSIAYMVKKLILKFYFVLTALLECLPDHLYHCLHWHNAWYYSLLLKFFNPSSCESHSVNVHSARLLGAN